MSSLCDTCRAPGACCKGFELNIPFPVEAGAAEVTRITQEKYKVPFVAHKPNVTGLVSSWQRGVCAIEFHTARPLKLNEFGTYWRFMCPALDPAGRCSIYESRPQVCRDFQAGSDPLCVHFEPRDAHETMRKKIADQRRLDIADGH